MTAKHIQKGPPVRRGAYLISVVEDDTDVLVRAILVDRTKGVPLGDFAEVVTVTAKGIRIVGGGIFVPHGIMRDLLRLTGVKRPEQKEENEWR